MPGEERRCPGAYQGRDDCQDAFECHDREQASQAFGHDDQQREAFSPWLLPCPDKFREPCAVNEGAVGEVDDQGRYGFGGDAGQFRSKAGSGPARKPNRLTRRSNSRLPSDLDP
jgi:hypothetical protein